MHAVGWAALAAGAATISLAAAQDRQERVSIEVGECIDLPTPEERLACFEAQVEAARSAQPAAAAPASAAPPATAPATAPTAAPTAAPTPANEPPIARQNRRDEEPTPPDILAKVTELRETVPNAYLITLDNGQVWRQTQPKYYPLRPGYNVRIYWTRWKTYRLTHAQLRSHIQVERVR